MQSDVNYIGARLPHAWHAERANVHHHGEVRSPMQLHLAARGSAVPASSVSTIRARRHRHSGVTLTADAAGAAAAGRGRDSAVCRRQKCRGTAIARDRFGRRWRRAKGMCTFVCSQASVT